MNVRLLWADNLAAIKLYKVRGFVEIGIAEMAPHPRLQHVGGSVLMQKNGLQPFVKVR